MPTMLKHRETSSVSLEVIFYYVMIARSLYSLHSFICSSAMPEGPELHLASLYVNRMCNGVVFTGPVRKSEVSKSPDVPFTCVAYRITATSRGKEVKLTLTPMKSDDPKQRSKAGQVDQPMDVVFRFGMSGYFRFTSEDELPKHSHLRFYSKEKPCRVLSFVDARRFGSWQPSGTWQPSRGPCIMSEYQSFRLVMIREPSMYLGHVHIRHTLLTDWSCCRENVISHLSDRAFDRPICEVLLNQKYFNGIGNYLRAEILFRWANRDNPLNCKGRIGTDGDLTVWVTALTWHSAGKIHPQLTPWSHPNDVNCFL